MGPKIQLVVCTVSSHVCTVSSHVCTVSSHGQLFLKVFAHHSTRDNLLFCSPSLVDVFQGTCKSCLNTTSTAHSKALWVAHWLQLQARLLTYWTSSLNMAPSDWTFCHVNRALWSKAMAVVIVNQTSSMHYPAFCTPHQRKGEKNQQVMGGTWLNLATKPSVGFTCSFTQPPEVRY